MTAPPYALGQRALLGVFAAIALALICLEARGSALALRGGPELPLPCLNGGTPERPCPGCGLLRGVACALHGDLASARRFHSGAAGLAALLCANLALRAGLARARLRGGPAAAAVVADLAAHAYVVGCWL